MEIKFKSHLNHNILPLSTNISNLPSSAVRTQTYNLTLLEIGLLDADQQIGNVNA